MFNFVNKKIAVLGLGIEGQDVCRFLLKKKAQITVFDRKSAVELGEVCQKFKKQGIEFRLGENYLEGFSARGGPTPESGQAHLPTSDVAGYGGQAASGWDVIFRSPAFKLSTPEIIEAQKAGVVVSSATKLFFDLCPAKIIGVTGTKGKGTTATLIYQILKKAGKKVYLAGNIGQPMLDLLPKLTGESWVVLELSSFQLQDLHKSPNIAVALFITSEHLDYHRNTQEYIQAKSNIVRHQKGSDKTVLNADSVTSRSFAKLTKAKIYYFSRQKRTNGAYAQNDQIFFSGKLIGKTEKLKLKGEHNWDNVCAAITTSVLPGADMDSVKKVVFSFAGLEHRLELVRQFKGISFYNDSFSTTP